MAAKTPDEMAEALKQLATHMAEQSKRTDASWENIADSITKASRSYNTTFGGLAAKLTGTHSTVHNIAHTLSGGLKGSRDHLDQMLKSYSTIYDMYKKLEDPSKPPSRQTKQARDLHDQLKAGTKELEAHRNLHNQIASIISTKTGAAMLALSGAFGITLQYSKLINQELIKASADTAHRSDLMRVISNVQAETGNEMRDMAKAAASLVRYGFDIKGNFRDTLATVVKMEEGLGVSYESSADMAVAVQRIGTNLKLVADGIARVKADTALSAEQATKFAAEISRAINLLKPGSGSMADQVIEYVNRLGGALQQTGENASDIKDLLISFTQEKGMMGAATLGATPDFLSSPERARQVTERFVDYVNRQLEGTVGFQRMATINLLAQQFGTTADLIANANKMLENYNTTLKHSTNLQEEWRNQTSEIGKTFSKIGESFRAIIQQSLLPALQVLRPALAAVADTVSFIAKNSITAKIAGIGLASVAAIGVVQFLSLSKSLLAAIGASRAYQAVIDAQSAASGVRGIIPRLLSGWLPRIGITLSRLVPIAGALLAGITLGNYINSHNVLGVRDYTEKLMTALMTRENHFQAQSARLRVSDVMGNIRNLVGRGASAAEIQDYLLRSGTSLMAPMGSASRSPEAIQKMVNNLINNVGETITTQRAALKYAGMTTQSEDDIKRQEEMIALFKQVAQNTDFQNKLLERALKKNEVNAEAERQERAEIKRDQKLQKVQDAAIEDMRKTHPMF